MLRLAYIVNNFSRTYDGVGAYGELMHRYFPKWIDDVVYTADCPPGSTWKKILSLGMTKQLFRACRDVYRDQYDACLIEYAFTEWQPLIMLPYGLLVHIARKRNTKITVSVHEYLRTNKLRRFVTRTLCRHADAIFVTDEVMAESMEGFTKKIFFRPIPINVYSDEAFSSAIERNRNNFIFFGIVSRKTKAFRELLDAWDVFNRDEKYQLTIVSVTNLGNVEQEHKGIRYYHDASGEEVIRLHRESAFCLLPIIPQIDMRSGTFKASCMCGCVGIGRFADELKDEPFVIHVDSYDPQTMADALKRAVDLPDDRLKNMSHDAVEWGRAYAPRSVAELVGASLREICPEKKDLVSKS